MIRTRAIAVFAAVLLATLTAAGGANLERITVEVQGIT